MAWELKSRETGPKVVELWRTDMRKTRQTEPLWRTTRWVEPGVRKSGRKLARAANSMHGHCKDAPELLTHVVKHFEWLLCSPYYSWLIWTESTKEGTVTTKLETRSARDHHL